MKSPTSTELLKTFIPHRPPMVWISEVISANESGGVCSIQLDLNAHYFNSQLQLRASCLIEWMAQSTAYTKAAHFMTQDKKIEPKKAYLVGVKKLIIHDSFYKSSHETLKTLYIKIETIKDLPPISLISGEVYFNNDVKIPLAQAQLKLFCE